MNVHLVELNPEQRALRRPSVDEWPLYVYRLADAEAVAQRLDQRFGGHHKGFWFVWSESNLRWNGERAGLLRLPQRSASMAYTLRFYRRMLGFQLTPFNSLGETDTLVDEFGSFSVSLLPVSKELHDEV